MAFPQRFNDVTCDITHISSLEVDRKYPIEHAERVTSRYGDAVLLSIRDTDAQGLYKLFLPNITSACSRTTTCLPLMRGLRFTI